MSLETSAEILRTGLKKLPPKDQSFASDLLAQYRQWGARLSSGRIKWIVTLATRIENGSPKPAAVGSAAIQGVIELLDRAAKHLKHPKIVVRVNKRDMRLSLAGPNSRNAGMVYVTGLDGIYFGKVSRDGMFEAASEVSAEESTAVGLALTALGKDPAKVAAGYGQLTGHCCFCMLPLTDARSTKVGYGQTCASKYGLPWG